VKSQFHCSNTSIGHGRLHRYLRIHHHDDYKERLSTKSRMNVLGRDKDVFSKITANDLHRFIVEIVSNEMWISREMKR
jgi:hypothetical protein